MHPVGARAKDTMKKHYENIHSLFQHHPSLIARKLFSKEFIDRSVRNDVANVQNTMSNETKADMLIIAVDKFFDTHTEPDKMLETLLDIFDECGPLGRNVSKRIRNECEYWCLRNYNSSYNYLCFKLLFLSLSLLFVTLLSLAYRLTLIYEKIVS